MDGHRKEALSSLLIKLEEQIERKVEQIQSIRGRILFCEELLPLLAKKLNLWHGNRDFGEIPKETQLWVEQFISHMSDSIEKLKPSEVEVRYLFSQVHAWVSGIFVGAVQDDLLQAPQATAEDHNKNQYQ
jgi:hypothetical protein